MNEYTATLVSIVPFPIREMKIGLYPGIFELSAYEEPISTPINKMKPSVLPIGESKHFIYIGEDRPDIVVPNSPMQVAKSVVNDYIESMLEVGDGASPGFFYLQGTVTPEEVATKHTEKLKFNKERQINWFKKVLSLADDDWGKYHKHQVISDLQRKIAQLMGLKREWLSIVDAEPPVTCEICTSQINPKAVVCPICRAILKPDIYKMYQFAEK